MFLRLSYSKIASLQLQLKLNILKKQKTLQNAYSAVWRKLFCTTPWFFSSSCKTFMKKLFPNTMSRAPTWISTHVSCPHLWRASWSPFSRHFASLFDFELWLTDYHCDVICDDWTKFASVHGTFPVRPLPCFKLWRFYFSEGVEWEEFCYQFLRKRSWSEACSPQ